MQTICDRCGRESDDRATVITQPTIEVLCECCAAESRAERAEADNLDNIMAALGMNADAARRLREENAALRAQLDAMQVAACPECGVTLAGKKLAPFGRSEGPDYSFRIVVDCAAPDEEARS